MVAKSVKLLDPEDDEEVVPAVVRDLATVTITFHDVNSFSVKTDGDLTRLPIRLVERTMLDLDRKIRLARRQAFIDSKRANGVDFHG